MLLTCSNILSNQARNKTVDQIRSSNYSIKKMKNVIKAIRYLMAGKAVNFQHSFISDTSESLSNSKIMKINNMKEC